MLVVSAPATMLELTHVGINLYVQYSISFVYTLMFAVKS